MHYLYPFFIGLFASIVGTLLPGLLNATVVKIAADEGRRNAIVFTSGTLLIIFFQAYLAINFARLIDQSVLISEAIQEIGLVVFTILTIYFLFFAQKPKKIKMEKVPSKKTRFFYGMFLATINMFPIPYYVFVSITASNYMEIEFRNPYTTIISFGVALGSGFVFLMYMKFFKNKSLDDNFILKNINKIIGVITGIIAVFTIFKILK